LPENLGVGYSYIRALEWALEADYDVFGTIASNGKMLPAEMSRLLAPIERGEADYVTGSRFMPGGDSPNLPGFRRNAIPWVNRFVALTTGARLTDATCGYRALRLDLIRAARFDWRAAWLYTYGTEYYLYAKVVLDRRLRWCEVPITMRYPPAGPYTKIKAGIGWWAMLRPWIQARLDGQGFDPVAPAPRATQE
jgi:glycosyltransferase involved in cell wall biosynthesis